MQPVLDSMISLARYYFRSATRTRCKKMHLRRRRSPKTAREHERERVSREGPAGRARSGERGRGTEDKERRRNRRNITSRVKGVTRKIYSEHAQLLLDPAVLHRYQDREKHQRKRLVCVPFNALCGANKKDGDAIFTRGKTTFTPW